VEWRSINWTVASGVSDWTAAIVSRRSLKYWTYRSGVNVFNSMVDWSVGFAKVCGAPGRITTNAPAGASQDVCPTVKRALPETTKPSSCAAWRCWGGPSACGAA
jgi:hypothetical protein